MVAVTQTRAMAVAEAEQVSSTAHCCCREVGETLGCSGCRHRRRWSLEAAGTAAVATETAAVAASHSIPGRRRCLAVAAMAAVVSCPIPGCCRCLEAAGTAAADSVAAVETLKAILSYLSCMGVGVL